MTLIITEIMEEIEFNLKLKYMWAFPTYIVITQPKIEGKCSNIMP